ncbi:plasmid replication initiator TrfA [Cupriavidus sp. D39]|uniref:plasmid replication initiator TrfA n=1 Tax=Cupriavidus sp. D39 TaxID=2997877 RepID=UPI002271B581|nr:plasmid replication initiator TrfA [Cupriavidus sp. D39]MCY0853427.1 plasmid replication initiator TrfA [Cupriavidus sp. D39]
MEPTDPDQFELVAQDDTSAARSGRVAGAGVRASSSARLMGATEKLLASAMERRSKGIVNAPVPLELPFWIEDKRGMPNAIARGALFTATKDDNREYYKGTKVATLANVDIVYKGEELRQDDMSVLLTVFHLARQRPLSKDEPVEFTAYAFLKEVGWTINGQEYKHLQECFDRLSANSVKVLADGGKAGYAGSLIRSFEWRDSAGKSLSKWRVWLEPKIAGLFTQDSFTLMEWSERKKIGQRSPLALWLHSFLSTHREPLALSVSKYRELCGAKEKSLPGFRLRLKAALQKLVLSGFLAGFEIKNDLVYVSRSLNRERLAASQTRPKQ